MQKIITARQARINYNNDEYNQLYAEINNLILDKSRTARSIIINTAKYNNQTVLIIRNQLKELGYECYYLKDYDLYISWDNKA